MTNNDAEPDLSIINDIICDIYEIEPYSISQGYCFIWVYLVKLIFPEAQLQYNWSHAWVCIDGEYFDSRYYKGAPAMTRITMFSADETDASLEKFIVYWCENGKRSDEFEEAIVRIAA